MAMPRKVNVDNLREVARAIERDSSMYNQKLWGNEGDGYNGTRFRAGVNRCNTPACLAGHAVAVLGNEEDFQQTYGRGILLYAQNLFNLPDDWADVLFSATWPDAWTTAMANDTLTVYSEDNEENYVNKTIPEAADAVKVLNHLANQFEQEQQRRKGNG